ncbi:MAG: hypothetical protein JSW08_03525 [archaeon]|nr:MAG: hypothetical protein JSW08_03525 [archaeon]
MIKETKPVSLAEVKEILSKEESERAKALLGFIKKFTKLTPKKAKEMEKELSDLKIFSLKPKDIVKIIDLMPEDTEDLRKILTGSEISLKQDEITKILEVVKKHKTAK